jgi:hypothetical protein
MEENPLQDLFESYVSDVYKLREAFHGDLASTAKELSQAMDDYAERSEAALTSFMEKVAARGIELEAAAAVRLDQFRGLPTAGDHASLRTRGDQGGLPNVNDGPLAHTAPDADQGKIAAAAERAVATAAARAVSGLGVEYDEAQKPRSGRAISLVRSEPLVRHHTR